MNPNDPHDEKIARYLDGESVELTDEQRAQARELRAGEAELSGALAVPCPPEARRRALRRMHAAVQASPRRSLRWVLWSGSVAAAAAVVLLAVHLFWKPALPTGTVVEITHVPTDVLEQALESSTDLDLELELLAGQIEQTQAESELATGTGGKIEAGIEDLQQDINRFWTGGEAELTWPAPDAASQPRPATGT